MLQSAQLRKKRFIWLPNGTKATYNGDDEILELPVGAALIKTFYYIIKVGAIDRKFQNLINYNSGC